MVLEWNYSPELVAGIHKFPGSKLVGLKYQSKRPNTVIMNKVDLLYLLEHPAYLKHLVNALR